MEMISEQYRHMLKFINIMSIREISKNSCTLIFYYLNQIKLCLNKSSNCVEYNELIFIKMDSTLTKLYIFVINYLFFKKKIILL
jgi:hypothetical protein